MTAKLAFLSTSFLSTFCIPVALAIPEPYFLRTAEFQAIQNDASVKQIIGTGVQQKGSGLIDGIRRTGVGPNGQLLYRVESGGCLLSVVVVRSNPGGVVGPGVLTVTHAPQLQCIEE